ncbi:MAG: hypothetical protein WED10_06450 [Brumimicrobium sp.]
MKGKSKKIDYEKLSSELPPENELIKQISLTSVKIWNTTILKDDILKWLENFKGLVYPIVYERKLALWLLSNFVFYNESEVKHLCKLLFEDYLHFKFKVSKREGKSSEELYEEILQKTRFYHLGKAGESSGYVLYYFRQENDLPIKRFVSKIKDLPQVVENVVFVDDVSLSFGDKPSGGSKNQSLKYINQLRDEETSLKDKEIYLLSFIATKGAIDYLAENDVKVISPIILDDTEKCFSSSSRVFIDFSKHNARCKKFAHSYGKSIKTNHPLGYNDGQFLFGFFYNTPDNTLPIFWSQENNWIPIIKRYHKNYRNNKLKELGRFV